MWNLKHTAAYLYRQYELVTCINMFEPWEKKLINGIVLFMFSLLIFSSYVYLPDYMEKLLQIVTPTAWLRQSSETTYVPLKMSRI